MYGIDVYFLTVCVLVIVLIILLRGYMILWVICISLCVTGSDYEY